MRGRDKMLQSEIKFRTSLIGYTKTSTIVRHFLFFNKSFFSSCSRISVMIVNTALDSLKTIGGVLCGNENENNVFIMGNDAVKNSRKSRIRDCNKDSSDGLDNGKKVAKKLIVGGIEDERSKDLDVEMDVGNRHRMQKEKFSTY